MKRIKIIGLFMLMATTICAADELTLEQCIEAAVANNKSAFSKLQLAPKPPMELYCHR